MASWYDVIHARRPDPWHWIIWVNVQFDISSHDIEAKSQKLNFSFTMRTAKEVND